MYVSSYVWSRNLKNEAVYSLCRHLRYKYSKVDNCTNMLTGRGTFGCETRDTEYHLPTEPDLFLADFYLNKASSVALYPT